MAFVLRIILSLLPRTILIRLSTKVIPLLDFTFRGNTFTDPINGKSYIRFLPYGYSKNRRNALSPGTFSLERHRLFWLYLKKKTNFFSKNLSVLHLAPEQCFHPIFSKLDTLEYVTTDLNSPLADVKADIKDLPFEDNYFDVVFCNHVLEHVANDQEAIMEKGVINFIQRSISKNQFQKNIQCIW